MARGKWFVLAFLPALLFVMSNCKDKSGQDRAAASRSLPAGSDRPLIGLTSAYIREGGEHYVRVGMPYVRSVVESGGAPVILPVIDDEHALERYVRELDGLIVIGGGDVPPEAYGQKPLPQTKTMPAERYEFESKLISRWLESDKPLLGICLGAQFVNVVAGGTLIQDIPTQVGTEINHRGQHVIIIKPDSGLMNIFNAERLVVNSSHHQAVKDVGKGLKVVAWSEDGIIEALEMSGGRFCLLVQWHPERMEDVEHRKAMFGAMVRACKKSNW